MTKRNCMSCAVLVAALLVGCTKYGPDDSVSSSAEDREKAMQSEARDSSTGADSPMRHGVAAPYVVPNAQYTMRCDLNSVAGIGLEPKVAGSAPRARQVVFNGWVVDDKAVPPRNIVIILKGKTTYGILATTGADRPDVAEAFKSSSAANAGFAFQGDTTEVAQGEYAVHIFAPDIAMACDTTKLLSFSGG